MWQTKETKPPLFWDFQFSTTPASLRLTVTSLVNWRGLRQPPALWQLGPTKKHGLHLNYQRSDRRFIPGLHNTQTFTTELKHIQKQI